MFQFETQSFFDFLKQVIGFFFSCGVGGGHNRKSDVHCSMPFWKITVYIFIVFIYLFNNISYSIAESKEIQKTEWFHEIGRRQTGRNPWLKTSEKIWAVEI